MKKVVHINSITKRKTDAAWWKGVVVGLLFGLLLGIAVGVLTVIPSGNIGS
jgi:hypothetical protein